jgi:nicotinamidase-related amidase
LIFLLGATAIDALSSGFRTVLIDDCCRGVDLQDIETTKESILSDHGVIVQSHEVREIIIIEIGI